MPSNFPLPASLVPNFIVLFPTLLSCSQLYCQTTGEADGKRNDDFRAAIVKYQQAEGLQATGTLNRETLDKMGIPLTEKQKATTVMPTPSATK